MTKTRTALVIGGGIAGPVTAMALRKAGIEATVYEGYESTADGLGGTLMLAPNGLNALKIVDADDAVRAVGLPTPRMVMASGTGKVFGEFDELPGLPTSQTLTRAELYRALHDRSFEQGIHTEYGKRLVGVQEGDSGITAQFADGSTATADVLIGADGIRSTVRTLIDPQAPGPKYAGLIGFGATLRNSGLPSTSGAMHFVSGKRGFFGYWTDDEGTTWWFGNIPHAESMTIPQMRAVPIGQWLAKLREVYADDVPARDILGRIGENDLEVGGSMEAMPSVPHWHRGRMVLVGDSAHAPSSSSGQGASLAVESAVELARCLRDLPSVPEAFAMYESLRRARVERVAAIAGKVNNGKAAGPVGRAVIGLVAPIMMKTLLKPEKMFGEVYRHRIEWNQPVAV